MKKFNIHLSYDNNFFGPIRKKKDYIKVLFESIYYILSYESFNKGKKENFIGEFQLHGSRISFFKKEKYFSVFFPYSLVNKDDLVEVIFKNNDLKIINIDYEIINKVLYCVNMDIFEKGDFPMDDENKETYLEDGNLWILIKYLLLIEEGYIRYDHDKPNYDKAKLEGREHQHPLDHYDIFYTNEVTFKLGLKDIINENDFLDLLDKNKDCKYLK